MCLSKEGDKELLARYPGNYKQLGDLTELDAFGVNHLFQIQDPSGCLQHAISKLLMTNAPHTNAFRDVREARDTLTRWLQLNQEIAR